MPVLLWVTFVILHEYIPTETKYMICLFVVEKHIVNQHMAISSKSELGHSLLIYLCCSFARDTNDLVGNVVNVDKLFHIESF